MTGWPDLTEEQVVALYCIEDSLEQAREGDRLGLCNEAHCEICTWHSETEAFEHYEGCRKKRTPKTTSCLDMKSFRVPVDIIQEMVCTFAREKLELPELTDGRQYGVVLEFIVEGRNPNGTPNAIAADVAMHLLPANARIGRGGRA